MRAKEPVGLGSLPNAETEVWRIGDTLGALQDVQTGAKATEPRARQLAPHARYIHFACHGYFDYRNPLDSGLILGLANADPDDPKSDGFLTAADILGMAMGDGTSLDADMVVLSACQTAVGKDSGGEGMIGLTRALMFAGTPTVVSTLWSVADESTKELMTRFYQNVKAGSDKAEALRQAQLSVRSDARWSNPYYWAPFALWGDW